MPIPLREQLARATRVAVLDGCDDMWASRGRGAGVTYADIVVPVSTVICDGNTGSGNTALPSDVVFYQSVEGSVEAAAQW